MKYEYARDNVKKVVKSWTVTPNQIFRYACYILYIALERVTSLRDSTRGCVCATQLLSMTRQWQYCVQFDQRKV